MSYFSLVVGFVAMVAGCSTPSFVTQTIQVPAEFPVNDSTRAFLIVDAAEVMTTGIALVKRREAVMQDVKTDYLKVIPAIVTEKLSMPVVIDTTISAEQKSRILAHDQKTIDTLLAKHNAGIMVVLKNCYGGFDKDEVVTERNQDGSKSKTAYYSVFFESTWQVIQVRLDKEKVVVARKPHSNRPIVSGLLARGPGFSANRKDIVEMARLNASEFTALFHDREIMQQVPVRQ